MPRRTCTLPSSVSLVPTAIGTAATRVCSPTPTRRLSSSGSLRAMAKATTSRSTPPPLLKARAICRLMAIMPTSPLAQRVQRRSSRPSRLHCQIVLTLSLKAPIPKLATSCALLRLLVRHIGSTCRLLRARLSTTRDRASTPCTMSIRLKKPANLSRPLSPLGTKSPTPNSSPSALAARN